METVSSYYGTTQPKERAGRKTPTGLLIGIEVELEKVNEIDAIFHWKKVKDGSLKIQGKEYTLCVWHTYAETYLRNLFNSLDKPSASPRCSVHIHADITDFTLDQLKALIIVYMLFEKALYRFTGRRWNNIFCVPVLNWAVNIKLLKTTFNELSDTFQKYSGLNVLPDMGKLGTVEFRHMAGNTNPVYIQTWINIIYKLMSYVKNTSLEEVLLKLDNLKTSQTKINFLSEVFKEYTTALNYSTFEEDMEDSILITKLNLE